LFDGREGSSMCGSEPAASVAVGSEYDAKIEDIAREGDGIAGVEGFVISEDAKAGDCAPGSQFDLAMRRFAIGHKI
jgi:predicted RNA-binding protein with TRAM domain